MTGSLPDSNLSLDLAGLIGRLRRQANVASRFGQMEDLLRLAEEFTTWQVRLRKRVLFALGESEATPVPTWDVIVNQIAEVRHDRDSAQMLHNFAADSLRAYDETFTRLRAELDEARENKNGR